GRRRGNGRGAWRRRGRRGPASESDPQGQAAEKDAGDDQDRRQPVHASRPPEQITPAGGGSVQLSQLDPLVILLENLLVRRTIQGHSVGPDLAHPDPVSPPPPEQ